MAVALISCALGCAGAPSSAPSTAPSPALDPAATQRLGQEIHALDQAAARATDVALAAGLRDLPVDGWIVVPGVPGLVVRFVGACPEGACAYLDVQTSGADVPPVALRAAPPKPLPEEQAAMWRARQTAATAKFEPCTRYYNTVVVPRDRDGVWRVYLLAATEDPDERVLTGHYRVRVSTDGGTLLSTEPLSKACIVEKRASGAAAPASLTLTDELNAEPIETHVFTSLSNGVPLYVETARGRFKVDGATIERAESPAD